MAVINGTSGNDILNGTNGNDVLVSRGGFSQNVCECTRYSVKTAPTTRRWLMPDDPLQLV